MIQKSKTKYLSFLLITFGFLMIGVNAYNLFKGYYSIEKTTFEEIIAIEKGQEPSLQSVIQPLSVKKIKTGEKIGDLTIPKLKETYPIYEGTTNEILKKGVGHYSHSALPGEQNNSILSGHRDTIFRGLKNLKVWDTFIVTTELGQFKYKIKKIKLVGAKDQSVIIPKPRATLTVTTCYPFYYIGNAPKRYILEAELISSNNQKARELNL